MRNQCSPKWWGKGNEAHKGSRWHWSFYSLKHRTSTCHLPGTELYCSTVPTAEKILFTLVGRWVRDKQVLFSKHYGVINICRNSSMGSYKGLTVPNAVRGRKLEKGWWSFYLRIYSFKISVITQIRGHLIGFGSLDCECPRNQTLVTNAIYPLSLITSPDRTKIVIKCKSMG